MDGWRGWWFGLKYASPLLRNAINLTLSLFGGGGERTNLTAKVHPAKRWGTTLKEEGSEEEVLPT